MRLLTSLIAFALLALPAVCRADTSYPTPDISKARLIHEEKQYIADRKPPTEIVVKTYKNPDGTLDRVYSVGGDIFRYDVDVDGGPPYEYRLIDTNGDGIFDTKEYMVGEMVVKDKGEKYFIDLGPEPGQEYKYRYEATHQPSVREQQQILMGYPIYIPQWVILRTR